MVRRHRRISGSNVRSLVLLWIITTMFTSACGYIQSILADDDLSQGKYTVDPHFEEFYQRLGGIETLGPAITPLYWEDYIRKQYVEAGLMVFDQLAVPNYYLAPLGDELGYSELSQDNVISPSGTSSFSLYKGFYSLHLEMGGEAVVGEPLSDVQFNAEKKRIEQHFENLGFYQLIDVSNARVQLLAYGLFACDFNCSSYAAPESAIIQSENNLPEPFLGAVNYLGKQFVGKVLTGPHTADDGNTEVIFENIVLYIDPNNPSKVISRPIIEFIGFTPHAPVERLDTDLVIFFIVERKTGYNIPVIFSDFLAQHGGLDVTGSPISEIFRLEDGVTRQCFANLCLDYHEDTQLITVAPLGAIYKSYTTRSESDIRILDVPTPPTEVQLSVWEENAFITSQEEQILYISVSDEGVASAGIVPTLTLTLPDGTQSVYRFAPTDENGLTFISIPPVDATNGTLIFYEICVEIAETGLVCVQDNYLIWGNR